MIFAMFFVIAGTHPPAVNEVHYLGKAKHYWDPTWCSGDFFFQSSDAHLLFYWTFGWLTRWMSLTAVAWTGRLLTWFLLAWSWRRLCVALLPRPGFAVLTAGLFSCFLACCHMAGEWLLGGLEAKGLAYVSLFLGLEALVRNRWSRCWLLLGAAAALHVLVGGWAVVATGLVWVFSGPARPTVWSMLPAVAGGLVLALFGLVPALLLSVGVDTETVRRANEIYVLERLPHHLSFHRILLQRLPIEFAYLGISPFRLSWPRLYFVRFAALLACWLLLCGRVRHDGGSHRLHKFAAATCVIALIGILIDQATLSRPAAAAPLLRYYWFRLSDVLVPLATAFVLGQYINQLEEKSPLRARCWLIAALLLASAHVADAFFRHRHDPRPAAVQQTDPLTANSEQRLRDWKLVCRWISTSTPADEVFLTPRNQQTFKWYAGRGEVVNWKDVPQNAAGIVAWDQRMREVYPPRVSAGGLAGHGEQRLQELARKYDFRYLVLDRSRSRRPLRFPQVYPPPGSRTLFEVYRLPRGP